MTHSQTWPALICGILLLMERGIAAEGDQHVLPMPNGSSVVAEDVVGDTSPTVCYNPPYEEPIPPTPPDPPPYRGMCCAGEKVKELGTGKCDCTLIGTVGKSYIDNINYSYQHFGLDYVVERPGSTGCAPCGGGDVRGLTGDDRIPSLELVRIHRFRDVAYPSSFGPGVFMKYDASIQLFTTAAGERYVDFFDPERDVATRFFDGPWSNNEFGYADPADGVYKDLISNNYRQMRLYDQVGMVTQVHANAVMAKLESYGGQVWTFQIIDLGGGVRSGRLVRVEDARGYGIGLNYVYQPGDDVQGSLARLWELSTITDAYGNSAVFHYATQQVAGRWVVDRIDLPTGVSINYSYANGYLSSIVNPDGTTSTFTYGWDARSQCTVLGINDASADQSHRHKSVYVTTNFKVIQSNEGVFMPQSAQLVRMVVDGANDVSYLNIPHPWATAGYVYEGGNALKYYAFDLWSDLVLYARYATSWNMSRSNSTTPWAWGNVAVTLEPGFHTTAFSKTDNFVGCYRNEAKWTQDNQGRKVQYAGFNSAGRYLGLVYPDGTTEAVTYNGFNQETRRVDRMGRVTEQTYDAVGNRLTRTTGSLWNSASNVVVVTSDTMTESWEYIVAGQVNQYRMKASIDGNGNRTEFEYDVRGRLVLRRDPSDAVGGVRPITRFEYDNASRLIKVIRPVETNWMSYTYDSRSRIALVSFADGSSESVSYGVGVDANLVVRKTDRNGNVVRRTYDLDGRVIQETISGPDQGVSPSTPLLVRSWTYVPGTNVVQSVVENGDLANEVLDYRNRSISSNRIPKAGVVLSSQRSFDGLNRRKSVVDPYNRFSWFVYDGDNREIRVVKELVAGALSATVPTDDAARRVYLSGLTRISGSNPQYVIVDALYNANGEVTKRIGAGGTVTSYGYSNRGQLISQIEAAGTSVAATTTFAYDAVGNRTSVAGPRSITAMTYTGRNLLSAVTEAVGTNDVTLIRGLTYTPNMKIATETDALGRVTSFDYGLCCDRLKTITDPAGFQTQFVYDFNGNRTSVTDANGLTSATGFDALNRPVTLTNGQFETTTTVYDENLTDGSGIDAVPSVTAVLPVLGLGVGANGSAIAVTNPKGETAYELRDGLGRTVARIDALGHATTLAYDTVVSGLVETAQTDALVHTTKSRVDAAGQVRVQIDVLGNQSTSGFSADGDHISQLDALGLGWSAVYDSRRRLVSRTTTRSGVVETTFWTYDLDGNRLTETDALGKTETSTYDLRNRRMSLIDRLGGITRFAYDAVGNLTQISDAENEGRGGLSNLSGSTQYAYDARNLLVAEAFPNGQAGRTLRTYGYDGGRRLTTRNVGLLSGVFGATPAFTGAAEATSYAYDAASRLITRGYADAKNDTFGYDPVGRLTSAASARYATTVSRAYDADGRLMSESLTLPDGSLNGTTVAPATYTVGYAYDAANRTTGITYPTGTQVSRTYTDRNELASVSMGGSNVATRAYDASGRLISTASANGVTESRSYVSGSPLVASIAAAPAVGPAATGFGYTYDAAGRKLSESDTVAVNQAFAYDNAGRLIDWKRGPTTTPTATQTWNLSLVGDWNVTTRDGVTETRQNSWVHEATQVGANLLTYDAKGNLTRDERQTLIAWDPENRLTAALITADASTSGFGARAGYRYDALGRRVAKTVQGRTTLYLNAGAQTVVELERVAIPIQAQVSGTEADGTVANASLSPASGGILATATRINFQPSTTVIPEGFFADTGKPFAVRSNGKTYGWSTDATANAVARNGAVPLVEYDTFVPVQTSAGSNSWTINLPNGSYPVIVVAGDALSTDQTNNLAIAGQSVTDATPATPTPTYEQGNFDGFAVQALVTNGALSITAGSGAVRAKLCFVEIGALGATLTQADRDRLAAVVAKANAQTGANPDPVATTKEFAYGAYVDEVLAYQRTVGGTTSRYYPHANHLYSAAALTNAAGQVVERYTYDAYGKQGITSATGVVRVKSAVGFDRTFTGYRFDFESGLAHANARYYSPGLGRYLSRDPEGGALIKIEMARLEMREQRFWGEMEWLIGRVQKSQLDAFLGQASQSFLYQRQRLASARELSDMGAMPIAGAGYQDGYGLYSAMMVPNALDPTGRTITCVGAGFFAGALVGGSISSLRCWDDCCPKNKGYVLCVGFGAAAGWSGGGIVARGSGCLSAGGSVQLTLQGAIGPFGGGGSAGSGGGSIGGGLGAGAGGALTGEICLTSVDPPPPPPPVIPKLPPGFFYSPPPMQLPQGWGPFK